MANGTVMNRWLVVVGAIIIQLCLGAIYAWSVFTPSLKEAGWTYTETQAVFAVGLVSFAVVMVWAGFRLKDIGPRKLAWAGGIVLGAGYLLAGLIGGTGFWTILVFVGLVGGAGIGLGYVVPIAVGMRWFPDKKGLVAGLAVAGFGFGAMGWVKLAGSWGHMIQNYGLSTTFAVYGVMFVVLVFIGGIWMVFPPEGYVPEGWTPPVASSGKSDGAVAFTAREMLGTPQFYLIFLTFIIGSGAGLMTIGLMKAYPFEALTKAGMSQAEALACCGTAMAVFFSLANGLGRILWGSMSDFLGRKRSIFLMTASQGVIVILFTYMAGNEMLLYLGATLIGFNFGGNFALFPSITADTFGNETVGQNYPWVFLAYGAGGILGPILGGKLGDLGNFPLAFTIAGSACLVAAVLIALVKPATKPTA